MIKCVSGKKVYTEERIAEEALLEAHIQYAYEKGKGPVNVYRCEDCGYFHLTSKGETNQRLLALLKDGKLAAQQRAAVWDRKLKHRR